MNHTKSAQLKDAIAVLKKGGVVLFPTETSYGLAVDARNRAAVQKLLRLKGRAENKSFPLIAASTTMARRFARMGEKEMELARAHWPGPLTLVVSARKGTGLAREVLREGTIAVRVSSNETARALSSGLGAPITSTSANRAWEPPAYAVASVSLPVNFVLDEGRLNKKKPSTIVRVVDGRVEILRAGAVQV